jgi:ribonuclease G
MAKEICISSTPHETRLAILEDDQLAEIYYERENEYTLAGSVYKGRVTRVLPGMQSAFVDIGLERDAFLYVTDFLEMEDPEDTEEVERAASKGDTVRLQPSAPQIQAPAVPQARPEREQRPRRDARPQAAEAQESVPFQLEPIATGEGDAPVPASVASAAAKLDETEEQSARRLRGRRRRRGGRGRDESSAPAPASIDATEILDEEEIEVPVLEFEAAASQPAPVRALEVEIPVPARASNAVPVSAAPVPFLLPGESLSKYGAPAIQKSAPSRLILSELPPDTSDPLPDRTVAKPSTLIEDEIVWDGKGLLPGESIARHRTSAPAAPAPVVSAPVVSEPSSTVDAEPSGVLAPIAETEEVEPVLIHEKAEPFEFSEPIAEFEDEPESSEEFDEEEVEFAPVAESGAAHEPETDEEFEESTEEIAEVHAHGSDGAEHEEEVVDASASHNVDPLPPSSFRLKDLFGGKKKEEEPAPAAPAPVAKPVASVSAYAPGAGVVEEEVIEEEEYEFTPLKAHHGDEHDLEEMEEETLQQQIRSGALGEMLQEAQLDRRILIESEDDDEDEEEDAVAPVVRTGAPGGGRERTGERGGRDSGRGQGRGGRESGRDRGRGGPSGPGGSGDGRRPNGPTGHSRRSAQTSDLPIISDLLKPGQEILVQIAKEPIAKKGARITSHIALPGRFLVFMPTVSHVGVSRKIASDEERQRLKRVLVSEKGDASGGFIVRTAADGASEEELRADLRFLINLWNDIKQRADSSKPPALIYHDLNLIERILRDQVSDNFSHIWVDSEADYERIVRFLNRFSPELVRRVKLYTKEVPLFEHFGIVDEISKALRSKVWLKSGGSIVINQTEALVAIDINTGKYVGKTARLEDTILKTNLDAIPEIVRQVRLRDLGGIIVIDFIDMDERKNRARVLAALEEALKQDRAPTKVLQFNDFGLVAITRKRVKQSLERTLSVPCPVCQATGMVKSPATVANEIYIEVRKMRKHFDGTEVLVRVNPETAKALKANNAKWLTELEELSGKNVLVKSDATLHPEQFDIQG